MKKILILGTGRSSSVLINYLLQNAEKYDWNVVVGDSSIELARQKIKNHQKGRAIFFDIYDETLKENEISNADAVISLLPPQLHFLVAKACLKFSKHLITASYISPEIKNLHDDALKNNILMLMEMGLDPGIDHMSAMKELDKIKSSGGRLASFKSYTGGLISSESDDNPWHYKVTWNPRNVVLAGKGTSKYLESGKVKEVEYKDLFKTVERISIKGEGEFEGYPNRDSLNYIETYNLKKLSTFLRGTLRRPGYCSAWNILVNLGFTDDLKKISSDELSYLQLTELLLNDNRNISIEEKLLRYGSHEDIHKIKWLGCLDNKPIEMKNAAPADVLQKLLESKLKLKAGDKDMIVMQHQFEYEKNNKAQRLVSSLVVKGDDEIITAMAKTVGLPLGIATKLILEGKIKKRGVQIPIYKEIYEPVLKELEEMQIKFANEEFTL